MNKYVYIYRKWSCSVFTSTIWIFLNLTSRAVKIFVYVHTCVYVSRISYICVYLCVLVCYIWVFLRTILHKFVYMSVFIHTHVHTLSFYLSSILLSVPQPLLALLLSPFLSLSLSFALFLALALICLGPKYFGFVLGQIFSQSLSILFFSFYSSSISLSLSLSLTFFVKTHIRKSRIHIRKCRSTLLNESYVSEAASDFKYFQRA